MRHLAALTALTALTGGALAQDLAHCTTLSFAPLDDNIPACSALLERPEGLEPAVEAMVRVARADAYEFALVYHGSREVDPETLLTAALADLDRAAALDPRHHGRRAEVLFGLGRFAEASESYTMAIAADPAAAASLLEGRSVALEAAGDLDGAIDDLTAAIRLSGAGPARDRLVNRRTELLEERR